METPGPHPNLQLGRGGRSKAKKGRSPGKGGERFSEPASYSRSSLALGGTLCNADRQHAAACCTVRQLPSAHPARSRAREWTRPSWGRLGSLPEEGLTPGVKAQDALTSRGARGRSLPVLLRKHLLHLPRENTPDVEGALGRACRHVTAVRAGTQEKGRHRPPHFGTRASSREVTVVLYL